MSEVGRISLRVDADAAGFHRGMAGVQQRLGQMSHSLGQFGGMMTRSITMPLVGVGVAAFKLGKDFEFEMQKIVGLVGIAQEQVDQWGKDILEMAPRLGKAPKELAEALYFITSAGIDAADALDVLEIAAKASAAGLGETKVIADLVTSAMNAYGIENLSAAHATDVLVNAVRQGKAEPAELAAALGQVLPVAAEMGISFEEVAAATAAMTRTGTNAQTAGTQLRAIMVSLLKPATQAETALNDMGTSSEELRKTIQDDGLLVGLMDIRELTNKYGEDAMAKVFPNIRALAGVLDLMGENMEDNIDIFESMNDVTGLTEDAFNGVADTAEFQFQEALAQVQTSLIELWEVLEGPVISVMGDLVEKLKELTDWFIGLTEEQQENILKWVGLIAIAGPVMLFLSGVLKMGSLVIGIFGGMSKGLMLLSGAKAGSFAAAGVAAKGAGSVISAGMLLALGKVALVAGAVAGLIYLWQEFNKLEAHGPIMPGYDSSHGLGAQPGIKEATQSTAPVKKQGGGSAAANQQTVDDSFGGHDPRLFFDSGGIVPGPIGAPQLAVVHGGETILPTHKTGGAIRHTGTIRVEGVNSEGQLMGVKQLVLDELYRETRG